MSKNKRTKEQLQQLLDEKGSNILLLGEYIGSKHKINCKCKICGNEQEITPSKLIQGQKCKVCTKLKRSKENTLPQEEFIKRAKLIHGDKYNYSKTVYIKAKEKVCIICPKHGEFWQKADNHLHGKGCPSCAREKSIPILISASQNRNKQCKEVFREKADKIHNQEYEYLEEYKTATQKIKVKHKLCGHTFYITPHNHIINKEGCPICNSSKGELQIIKILKENNINYTYQYEIPIDKFINPSGKAQVDFYIPDKNAIIEYNGIQHYIPVKYFGGEIQFEKQQERDSFIRNYCKENNIKLIELTYNNSEGEILKICKQELL